MTITLVKHVSATETNSGMVLLDERTGYYWQLNGTAATVLRLLLGGSAVGDVISVLREQHPIGSERAADDVRDLLSSLRDAKLVKS